MKKGRVLLVALALLALVAGTAHAEMFVEAYVGGNFGAASKNPFRISPDPASISFYEVVYGYRLPSNMTPSYPGHIDPAFQGGLKFGAWFDQSGVLSGINFPSWMKYTGFYLDFSYHRLNFATRTGTKGIYAWTVQQTWVPVSVPMVASSEGNAVTLAFMFAFRYGFFPDKEVPFGRLQPYLAVGPAILFSSQVPDAISPPDPIFGKSDKFPSDSSADIALAVETGVRWMCLKNVSVDVSFKYRHAAPTYKFNVVDEYGFNHTVWLKPIFNLFSVQVGAALHF